MYKVIEKFADLKDERHIYSVGDVYPREGHTASERRIAFLLSDANRLGKPVIEEVADAELETEAVSKKKPSKKSK